MENKGRIVMLQKSLKEGGTEEYENAIIDDEELTQKTKEQIPDLESQDIDVYEQRGNVLVTSAGYYVLFWESFLREKFPQSNPFFDASENLKHSGN